VGPQKQKERKKLPNKYKLKKGVGIWALFGKEKSTTITKNSCPKLKL
jgi:hypothetical protein